MSDMTLLLFGCVVSFITAAGAYVYVRERFTASEDAESDARDPKVVPGKWKDVA